MQSLPLEMFIRKFNFGQLPSDTSNEMDEPHI